MPRTAEDSKGRLSDTKITDFSSIMAQSTLQRAEKHRRVPDEVIDQRLVRVQRDFEAYLRLKYLVRHLNLS